MAGFPIDAPGIRALPASPFQGQVQAGETVGVMCVSGEDAQTLVIVKRTVGDGIGGKVVGKANRGQSFLLSAPDHRLGGGLGFPAG